MTKLSDADFDKVVTEFQKTTVGAAIVKDYVAIVAPAVDADGNPCDGDPTPENAFVVSCRQVERAGQIAFTRIDIRGPGGLIHTSYEQDHVVHEVLDAVEGKELLADVFRNVPSTKPGALPTEFEPELLIAKGTLLTAADVDTLRSARIVKVPTKPLTADEIAANLKPFLDLDHEIAGTRLTANELGALAMISKTSVEARPK